MPKQRKETKIVAGILGPFQDPLLPSQIYFGPKTLLRIQLNALCEHSPLINRTLEALSSIGGWGPSSPREPQGVAE